MTNRWLVAYAILTVTLLSAQKAVAVEPLSTKELAEHCIHYAEDTQGKDAIFCVRYIQGFIDGAVATDERVAVNVAAEMNQKETFAERAIRMRSPARRSSTYGATAHAEFCIGAPIALKEVVEHVIVDLKTRKVVEERLLARDAVYAVLRRDYACKPE